MQLPCKFSKKIAKTAYTCHKKHKIAVESIKILGSTEGDGGRRRGKNERQRGVGMMPHWAQAPELAISQPKLILKLLQTR